MKDQNYYLMVFSCLMLGAIGGFGFSASKHEHFEKTQQKKIDDLQKELDNQAQLTLGVAGDLQTKLDECRDRYVGQAHDLYGCSHDLTICQQALRGGWKLVPIFPRKP